VVVVAGGVLAWVSGVFDAPPTGTTAPATTATPVPPPAAPAPAPEPAPVAEPRVPSFDVVRVEPDGTAVLAGRAEPGATVAVRDGDTVIGTVVVDSRGEWVLIPTDPLAPGGRELTVTETLPDGREIAGGDSVVLVVPERNRDIAGRPQGETGGALAVLAPDGAAPRVLQAPPTDRAGNEPPLPAGGVTVDAIDYDRAGRVTIGGRAEAGAEVMVYLDNTLVGRAKADAGGRWSLSPDRPLDTGSYAVRVDRIKEDGQVTARAEVGFDRRDISDTALGGKAVVVLPGNNLWTIARRSFGQGPRYTLIFEANQGQIRDPDLIYPGQIFILPNSAPGQ